MHVSEAPLQRSEHSFTLYTVQALSLDILPRREGCNCRCGNQHKTMEEPSRELFGVTMVRG